MSAFLSNKQNLGFGIFII